MSGGSRVLLVSAEYPPQPGGIGDYTALLARHLAAAGAAVTVLTSGTGEIRAEGAVTVRATMPRWDWRIGRAVRAAVRETGAEIVHLQYQTGMYGMHPAMNALPALRAARRFPPARFVTTFHDLRHPYLFPKAGPLRPRATRLLARASDAAIATNGADYATLRRWDANTHLIPLASSIPAAAHIDRDAIRARYGIEPRSALLTTFGLLNHSKGIGSLIEALVLLRAGGTDARLLLVGAGVGGSDPTNVETERQLAARCDARGVTSSVTWTGTLAAEEVAAVLAAGDVCVLPYRDGASPRRSSLIAALAQGIPIVTTAPAAGVYAGLPEPRDGETLRFVPPDDPAALAGAIRGILGDPSLAARLRAGARAYAAQLTWPAIARQHLALYASLAVPASCSEPVAVAASEGDD